MLDCDKIFVPVHIKERTHWVMMVVDINERSLHCYDSLYSKKYEEKVMECLGFLASFVRDESISRKRKQLDTSEWRKVYHRNAPQQTDWTSCGVFSCKIADFESKGIALGFGMRHVPYFRKRIAAELMAMRAL